MSVELIIPAIAGWLAGWLINYLADMLPFALRLNRPMCQNAACKTPFSWRDYLLFRNCRKCGRKRGLRTYAVQTLTVIAAIYLWLSPPQELGFDLGFGLLAYLLVVIIIDLEHRWILRPLSITGLLLGSWAGMVTHGWQSTLIGAAAGFGMMFLLYLLGKLFSRLRARRLDSEQENGEETLGSGDVTLAIILGLILGWPLIWFGLLLGTLIAGIISLFIIIGLLVTRNYKKRALTVFIPYGACFILGAVVLIYLPNWIVVLVPK